MSRQRDKHLKLMGIQIHGCVWRTDEEPLSEDEFWDAFIDFVEGRNWFFGGSTVADDLNDERDLCHCKGTVHTKDCRHWTLPI